MTLRFSQTRRVHLSLPISRSCAAAAGKAKVDQFMISPSAPAAVSAIGNGKPGDERGHHRAGDHERRHHHPSDPAHRRREGGEACDGIATVGVAVSGLVRRFLMGLILLLAPHVIFFTLLRDPGGVRFDGACLYIRIKVAPW